MAELQSPQNTITYINNGYCSRTKTYHSLLPAVPLPPLSQPLSIISYTLSLLRSPTTPTSAALSTTAFLVDNDTGHRLTYSTFLQKVGSLSSSLKSLCPSLSKNDVAFVLSPPSLHIPVLYFSLLSLGIAVSPSNPLSSPAELVHQIQLSKPAIAFSTSAFAHKLPPNLLVVLLDSPQFLSMLESRVSSSAAGSAVVNQSDPSAILYSSGTTGKVKGVVLTHRNLIAVIGGYYHNRFSADEKAGEEQNDVYVHPVSLFTLPLFHVFGFFMLLRAASVGESVVLTGKFDFVKMLEAVEKHRVTYIPVAPPLVVAMAKSDLVDKYDLTSLQTLRCGGAPLGKEISERFRAKFPNVEIYQVQLLLVGVQLHMHHFVAFRKDN